MRSKAYLLLSDILATLNGLPINSYNIGGETVIIVEDLKDYGFNTSYDNNKRELRADSGYLQNKPDTSNITRGKVGMVLGNIYKTDIVTYVNDIEIPSYNIGGKTCVSIEQLGDLKDSIYKDVGFSKYYINCHWDYDNKIISFNALISNCIGQNVWINDDITRVNFQYNEGNEGKIFINNPFKNNSHSLLDGIIPLRVYDSNNNPTNIIGGYLFDNKKSEYTFDRKRIYIDHDKIKEAYSLGYSYVTNFEDVMNSFKDNGVQEILKRFDTDEYAVIYRWYMTSFTSSSYQVCVISKIDGSVVAINFPKGGQGFGDPKITFNEDEDKLIFEFSSHETVTEKCIFDLKQGISYIEY